MAWMAVRDEIAGDVDGAVQLLPLKADASRYVQNSVANWLNDAAKTQPEWVREVCEKWGRGTAPATQYIVWRAQRSIQE